MRGSGSCFSRVSGQERASLKALRKVRESPTRLLLYILVSAKGRLKHDPPKINGTEIASFQSTESNFQPALGNQLC